MAERIPHPHDIPEPHPSAALYGPPPRRRSKAMTLLLSSIVGLAMIWTALSVRDAFGTDSLPPAPDTDPGLDVSVTDGVTVRVASQTISLVTSSDKTVVSPGSTVTYTYRVTATGPFKNLRLEDDKCSPVSGPTGDANLDKIIQATETWTYTCKTTVLKDQTNLAKLTATPVLDAASATPTPTPTGTPTGTTVKDGTYTGSAVPVVVPGEGTTGTVQVQAVVSGGVMTQINVLQCPKWPQTNPRLRDTSWNICEYQVSANPANNSDPANPTMISQALAAQGPQGVTVASTSGASYTGPAFKQSLTAALLQAAA